MVSGKADPSGAGEEFKDQQTKKNQYNTSEFFLPTWRGTSLELVLYILCKHYCSNQVVQQIKAGVDIPEHPIFDESLIGMAAHEASHPKYKQVFMALFIKKKSRGQRTGTQHVTNRYTASTSVSSARPANSKMIDKKDTTK